MPLFPTVKVCSHCKEEKSLSEFYKNRTRKDGLHSQCKQCMSRFNSTVSAALNKSKYKKKHPNKILNAVLKYKFDITRYDYDQMFEKQNGVCAICGKPEWVKQNGVIRRLSIDHNHKTGQIRQLLCQRCNLLVGQSEEKISLLLKIAEYIERWQE